MDTNGAIQYLKQQNAHTNNKYVIQNVPLLQNDMVKHPQKKNHNQQMPKTIKQTNIRADIEGLVIIHRKGRRKKKSFTAEVEHK